MRKLPLQLVASLGLLIALFSATLNVYAFADPMSQLAQTIPTRTPPGGPPPTDTPPPPPPPTAEPPTAVPPTNTPLPALPTNTPAASPTATNTPGGFLATAVPCGEPATVRTNSQLAVRQGPGNDYPILITLPAGSVRPIIGRAEPAQYWQIELADGRIGWVPDQAVTVNGYTGNVPLAAPPPINGNTPTPASGPAWNPTPNPACITPTPTATPTQTSTATAATPSPTPTTTAGAAATAAAVTETAAAMLPLTTAMAVTVQAQAAATAVSVTMTAVAAGVGDQPVTADPLPASRSGDTNWILIAGIALILLGGGYALIGRWRGNGRG